MTRGLLLDFRAGMTGSNGWTEDIQVLKISRLVNLELDVTRRIGWDRLCTDMCTGMR